jgi:anti-sigma factor (TIGR02949 family)
MTADRDMDCKELVEVVTEYLEGAMGPEDTRRFEEHLAECPYCIEYLDQMRELAGGLGDLGGETIAPQTRDALLEAFRRRGV